MKISDSQTIAQIQTEFTELFPGLKIEFYKEGHQEYMPSSKDSLIIPTSIIGDIRTNHHEGDLKLSPTTTVVEIENQMKERYGLNIQIFRKSKDIWLQTSATDDWTLAKQNSKGLHSMNPDIGIYSQN